MQETAGLWSFQRIISSAVPTTIAGAEAWLVWGRRGVEQAIEETGRLFTICLISMTTPTIISFQNGPTDQSAKDCKQP